MPLGIVSLPNRQGPFMSSVMVSGTTNPCRITCGSRTKRGFLGEVARMVGRLRCEIVVMPMCGSMGWFLDCSSPIQAETIYRTIVALKTITEEQLSAIGFREGCRKTSSEEPDEVHGLLGEALG